MHKRFGIFGHMLLAAAVVSGIISMLATAAQTPDDLMSLPAKDKLATLSWMEGQWRLGQGGRLLEETWSGPEADCMIGMFRWIRGGKAWMYELMSITIEEDDSLVFRLRHFSRKHEPWEKDGPLEYTLVRLTSDEAVFENPERDKPRRFVFQKQGDDGFAVRLEPENPADATDHDAFRYQRVR